VLKQKSGGTVILAASQLDKEIKELLRDYAVHDMLQQLKALEEGEAK
jgi:hypothetical protein